MGDCLDYVEFGTVTLNVRATIPWAGVLDYTKKKKPPECQSSPLSCDQLLPLPVAMASLP